MPIATKQGNWESGLKKHDMGMNKLLGKEWFSGEVGRGLELDQERDDNDDIGRGCVACACRMKEGRGCCMKGVDNILRAT